MVTSSKPDPKQSVYSAILSREGEFFMCMVSAPENNYQY